MGRTRHSLAKRALEKQRSRDEDRRRLEQGDVSPEELRAENSFLNLTLPLRIVDFGRPLGRRELTRFGGNAQDRKLTAAGTSGDGPATS